MDDIHIPFLGISLWKMFEIYGQGLFANKIGRRAAAISWNFVFSLFPFILFLLSVLPILPHYDKLQFYIFEIFLPNIFPGKIESDVTDYIQNNIIPNTAQLSNWTILLALIFATNGTFAVIDGFNEHTEEKHNDVKEFIISFFVTIGFVTIVLLGLYGIYQVEVKKLFTPNAEMSWLMKNLTRIIGFVSFPLFYFLLLTLFYWVGTVKITKFTQAIPGAILTTFLFILTTYLFAIYIKNFARYNVLYGSIGSMILLMVWVNVNVYLLLFGNELNFAIRRVRIDKLIADEMNKDVEDFQSDVNQKPELNKDHQRIFEEKESLENQKNQGKFL